MSFRDDFGQWDPKNQRPELWNLYNGRIRKGEHVRVFPLSNWTELDVWQYVAHERIELPSIYFAHDREVFRRDGMLYAASDVVEQTGPRASRNQLQTTTLLDAIEEHGFDAAIGGARRDEERARAKERIFSFRDEFGQWNPRGQRPELWTLYNARVRKGEHVRVFPISNWTELDVWQYIARERLEVPSIYFAHVRPVVRRGTALVPVTELTPARGSETVEHVSVRFRTVGDITCTAPVASDAASVEAIIAETAATTITERGATRLDDQTNDASMELRKKEGYF